MAIVGWRVYDAYIPFSSSIESIAYLSDIAEMSAGIEVKYVAFRTSSSSSILCTEPDTLDVLIAVMTLETDCSSVKINACFDVIAFEISLGALVGFDKLSVSLKSCIQL